MTAKQALLEPFGHRITAALMPPAGAAAIGAGVASMMPATPAAIAVLLLLAGTGIHIGGMVAAHRAGAKASAAPSKWHQALTIVCWIALIGFATAGTAPFTRQPH